jgi:AcrR family transcriptional regulator
MSFRSNFVVIPCPTRIKSTTVDFFHAPREVMPGKREEKKQRTRQAILEAAIALFTHKGYSQTTVADLAHAAGIGKGTIYTYFQGKSSIFLAFFEEQLELFGMAITEADSSSKPLLQRLVAVYREEFRFIIRYPEFGRILMRETLFPRDLDSSLLQRLDQRYIDLLVPMLKKAQEQGELRRDLELTLVLGHIYSLYAIVVSAWFRGRLSTEEDILLALSALFEQALAGLAPPEHNPASPL